MAEPMERRVQNAVDRMKSLNLDDMDIIELERRIELIRKVEQLATTGTKCGEHFCHTFSEK